MAREEGEQVQKNVLVSASSLFALGSNPADCPIFCLYLPSKAHSDSTPPLSDEALGDTEALRVSQHQGVYWQALLFSFVARRFVPRTHQELLC